MIFPQVSGAFHPAENVSITLGDNLGYKNLKAFIEKNY